MHDTTLRARRASAHVYAACALVISALGLVPNAEAQEKQLIAKWLSGEVKANFPKVTYDGPPITIRYSSFVAPNSPVVKTADPAFKLLEQASNGKLIFKPYWGNTLSNAQRGAFESIAGGVTDAGQAYVVFNPGGFTTHLALAVPFVFESSSDASWAMMDLYPKYLKKEYEAKGVYMLRLSTTPPQQILTRKPIEKLEDLKGTKIWVPGGFFLELAKSLGMVGAPLQTTEAYLAFQNGVVDALLTHDAGLRQFRFAEIIKFRTETKIAVTNTEHAINKATFDKLPKDLKDLLIHWSQLWNQVEIELYFHDEAKEALKELDGKGIKSTKIAGAERDKWKAAAQPAVDAFLADLEKKGAPAKQFYADLQAAAAKWRAKSADQITKELLEKPLPGIVSY
jgi:TRAP-type C4-dicarboxylate transport system substrate-binding protein